MPGGQRAAQPGVAKLSKSTISKVITALLLQAGIDDTGFTSKSMRKGGLSTAKRAGIPAALRKEQSNHVSRAHKVYEYDGAMPDIPRQKPFSTRRSVQVLPRIRTIRRAACGGLRWLPKSGQMVDFTHAEGVPRH